jgi:hypothetical protein
VVSVSTIAARRMVPVVSVDSPAAGSSREDSIIGVIPEAGECLGDRGCHADPSKQPNALAHSFIVFTCKATTLAKGSW